MDVSSRRLPEEKKKCLVGFLPEWRELLLYDLQVGYLKQLMSCQKERSMKPWYYEFSSTPSHLEKSIQELYRATLAFSCRSRAAKAAEYSSLQWAI